MRLKKPLIRLLFILASFGVLPVAMAGRAWDSAVPPASDSPRSPSVCRADAPKAPAPDPLHSRIGFLNDGPERESPNLPTRLRIPGAPSLSLRASRKQFTPDLSVLPPRLSASRPVESLHRRVTPPEYQVDHSPRLLSPSRAPPSPKP